jgi:hypothetical protein
MRATAPTPCPARPLRSARQVPPPLFMNLHTFIDSKLEARNSERHPRDQAVLLENPPALGLQYVRNCESCTYRTCPVHASGCAPTNLGRAAGRDLFKQFPYVRPLLSPRLQSHVPTFIIYKLSFNENCYTLALLLLIKFANCIEPSLSI